MTDNSQVDDKIIVLSFKYPSLTDYGYISRPPEHSFNEISHFFRVYKFFKYKETVINKVLSIEAALESSRSLFSIMTNSADLLIK